MKLGLIRPIYVTEGEINDSWGCNFYSNFRITRATKKVMKSDFFSPGSRERVLGWGGRLIRGHIYP